MTNYDTGYKKPPVESQFKEGRSGNPKGRPKMTKNLASAVYAACNEKVRMKVGNEVREMTKLRAYLTQLSNKAASGDVKAGKELLRLHHASGVGQLEEAIRCPRIIVNFVEPNGNGGRADRIPPEPAITDDEEDDDDDEEEEEDS